MKVDIFNTDKKYQIIYADPPWEYRNMGNIQATANAHYPTMKQADIENLPVSDLADTNSILFLWATFPKIQEALNCMKAWGFEYKTVGFTWVKKNKRGGALFRRWMVHKVKRGDLPHWCQGQAAEGIQQGVLHSGIRQRGTQQKARYYQGENRGIFGRYSPYRTLRPSVCGWMGLLGE